MATMSDPERPDSSHRATMKQVATLAGVGLKTVSRVINDEPYVSQEITGRVRAAAEQLDYLPNPHAGVLRSKAKRHLTIGLLVGSVDNPFVGALHRVIEEAAHEHDAAVFASSLDDDPHRERGIVQAFLRRRLDGLILTTVTPNQSYLVPEQRHGTQFVFVDRPPTGVEADAIISDNAEGAAAAARHLIAHGHRRLAYLGDRHEIKTAALRREGFLGELSREGILAADTPVVEGLHDEESSYRAVLEIMRRPEPPTALFTAQNLVTIGAIRALRDLGVQRSTALVSFDDIPLSGLLDPAITVIAQHPDRIGALAAKRMFDRIAGDDSPAREFVVPTTLIVRGSGEIPPHD